MTTVKDVLIYEALERDNTKNSLSIFSKYKDDKRIQKEIIKRQETIEKARNRWSEKVQKEIEKSKNDILARNEKQLARFEKKQRIQAEKKTRDIVWLKQTKKTIKRTSDSVKYWRSKAYREFQLYARLIRVNSRWMCKLWCNPSYSRTTWYEHREKTQWWHIYSKHNYPHLAFYLPNCRPILARENKRQWDSIADRQDSVLSKQEQEWLADMAYDATPEQKKQYQTKEYYQEQYEKYKALNVELLMRVKHIIS